MLVRSVDRRVHRNRPVDLLRDVGFGKERAVGPVPRPIGGVSAMTLPDRLQGPNSAGRSRPGNAAAVPVNDAFHDLAVAPERAAPPSNLNLATMAQSGTTGHR